MRRLILIAILLTRHAAIVFHSTSRSSFRGLQAKIIRKHLLLKLESEI